MMGNHVAASGHPFSLQLVVAVGGGWAVVMAMAMAIQF